MIRLLKSVALLSLLAITACSDNDRSPNNADNLDHVYTYKNLELAAPLLDPASCVNYSNYCTVEQLPFIALSYPETQLEDIISRVVVSHEWMGKRFAELLPQLPDEIITLLGSVTAIVISDNIRPSFYWTGSGAIYLDAANLWLTNAEKSTVNQSIDYRSGFGEKLSYDFFHRFMKENEYAYFYYPLDGTQERSIEDIIIPMASLLFHELAHANDFMPQSLLSSLTLTNSTSYELSRLAGKRLNLELQNSYPLVQQPLFDHAAILYKGKTATLDQQSDSAAYLADLMQTEGANHLYSYSNPAEDVAMLFQATMLKKTLNVDMDSAFIIKPEGDNLSCSDYIVAWGERNRIAEQQTKSRALFVAQRLLPDSDFHLFFDSLESAQTFPPLTNWCNTDLSAKQKVLTKGKAVKIIRQSPQHGVTIYK